MSWLSPQQLSFGIEETFPRISLVHEVHQQTSNKTFGSITFQVCLGRFPLYTCLIPPWCSTWSRAVGLVVVTDRQHQRNEAAQHQSSNFHLAQSFPSVPRRRVAVAGAPYLRKDVDGGHVEERAG